MPAVTIQIASINITLITELCIKSIFKYTKYEGLRIVIRDSGSIDLSLPRLIKLFKKGLIHDLDIEPMGRAHLELLDYWTKNCKTDYVVFMDSDIEILQARWLENIIHLATVNSAAMVTTKILNEEATTYRDFTGVTRRLHPRPTP